MSVELKQLLEETRRRSASDLHLKVGAVPLFRINGDLVAANHPPVNREDMLHVVEQIVPQSLRDNLKRNGSVDFGYTPEANVRFRTNVFLQRGVVSISMRLLEYGNLSFAELNLPPILEQIARHRRGIILCTGPTGSGKTTTLAAIVDYINSTRKEHIITVEDPIEFLHRDKLSLVEQREIGFDTCSYERALRDALREDPNVIVIGEMRDAETMTIAMRAAITGHLVISTLHTSSAINTVNRILNYFPKEEKQLVREDLAGALRAVVSQILIPSADGKGRVPVVEIMICNDLVRKLMLTDRIDDIQQVLRNALDGMRSFDNALVELSKAKKITAEVGYDYSEDKAFYKRACAGVSAGDDKSRILDAF